MRRLTSITVLAVFSLVSLSVNAQRGGMGGGRSSGGGFHSGGGFRSGGGFHSAPGGGFRSAPGGGFRSAPVGGRGFAPGPRTFAPAGRSFAPRTFVPAGGHGGFHSFAPGHRFAGFPGRTSGFVRFGHPFPFHNHFHNHFFAHGCFGCFSPFFFSGGFFFGDPFFGGPFFGAPYYGSPYYYPSDYYGPPAPPTVVSSDNSSNVELATQVQRLADEVDELQTHNYQASRPSGNSGGSISAKEPGVAAVFVFKDGRRITALNYAIAGETLWILDEHAARKFSLDQLDRDATQQANAANGLDLRLTPSKP